MASIVQSNLTDGTRLEQTDQGYQLTVTYEVTGLTGSDGARLYDALSATGIPAYGAACTITGLTALKVVSRSVDPSGGTNARVTVVYRKPTAEEQPDPADDDDPPVETITASLASVKTNLDYNDALITVTHNGISQNAEVEKQLPVVVMKYRRKETQRPFTRAINNVGKTNNTTFEGRAARTVLCTNVTGESDDGGATYTVDYEFQYVPETWDALVYWIDPETNRPPADLVNGTGYKRVQIYETADFAGLNL